MEVPKKMRVFCPHCKKHTEHAVKTQKTSKKRSKLGHAERLHQDRLKGYHGFPIKVTGKTHKVNKKHTLLLTCPECKKSLLKNYPRLKTLEIAKE